MVSDKGREGSRIRAMVLLIGDIQGCDTALERLLQACGFSPSRDRLVALGDLVNRGPGSLAVLRRLRALEGAAECILGNHDLHLLAVAFGSGRRLRPDDTLDDLLSAPDRDPLLEWLATRPLAVREGNDLMIHAGVVPEWTTDDVLALAGEVESALRADPRALFESMYGNRPDQWSTGLSGHDRLRFVINVLTRLRFCRPDGRIDLKMKGAPGSQQDGWMPWFDVPGRRTRAQRLVTGHWSTLGLLDRDDLLTLDTGCVWGGALTAASLEGPARWRVPCAGYQAPE